MRKIIIFPIVLILLAVSVLGFIIDEKFGGSTINTTNFINKSVSNTMFMNVSDGVLNMYGNITNGGQFYNGLNLHSKQNITTGENGELYFTLKITNTAPINSYFYGGMATASATGGLLLTAQGGDSFYILDRTTGARACGGSSHALDNNQHIFRITATRDSGNTIFNTYWDYVLWCSVTHATTAELYANISATGTGNAYHKYTLDNLYFSNNDSNVIGYLAVGDWCDTSSDCLSNNCEYHHCALKVGGKPCNSASECLSGSCVNSHCGQTNILTNLEASKNQLFGNTSGANNFICLFIILGVGIMIVFAGGGLFAMGWVVLSTIFFVVIGWLSAFFLVGLFLIGLIVVVLGITIGSKG